MLDNFFTSNSLSVVEEHGSYNYMLVGLSYVVASLASYLALVLARYLAAPQNPRRRRLLQWGGALALGAGIWSMHFIGMLAFKMDMPMGYDPALTLLSLAVAIFSAYGVLRNVSHPHLKIRQIVGSAVLLGIGISAMHYIGMFAMVLHADMRYRADIFALSIAIAMVASGAALWICFTLARHTGKARKWLEMCAALIMAAAICGMHYTGMAAAVFTVHLGMQNSEGDFTTSGIALGVSIVGVILSIALPIVVYQTIRDDQDDEDTAAAFPTKLLSLTVVCSFAVLTGLAGYNLQSQNLLQTALTDKQIKTLALHLGWMSYIAIFAAIVLAVVWYFALRSIRRWRRELRDNKTLLRTILDNMPLALFAKDASNDYRWLFINRMAEDIFCLKNSNIMGRPDSEFFPKEEADFFRRTDEAVMEGGKLIDIEAEPVTTPKGTFTAHTIKVPIYNEYGKPHILLGMFEDVTEKIRAKKELQQAKERAEQADQAKSEFLANMSHELRTPLNSILGMTRLLQQSDISADQKAMTETVLTSSVTLLDIVNDILDLSKIEAGALELEQIGFDLSYVQECVIDRLKPLAREKNLALTELKESIPPYVLGDPTRLSRILTNLLSNAIKYTDHGNVQIKSSHAYDGEGRIIYYCGVTDTGIGIPADKHDGIFEKFVQADTSTTRKYGGTGLGLAITKQLVEMMGGTIGLTSEIGKGSTFWFKIPILVTDQLHREKSTNRLTSTYSSIEPAKARILVAEDHPMNQVFISKLLQHFGIKHFKIVGNGKEAIEQIHGGDWDMVLMDCHMPEKNGYDATVDIRAMEKTSGSHIPIIAMTANAMVGDREKCLRCGMDDHISKPIVMEELAKLMGQWIDFREIKLTKKELNNDQLPCINLSAMRSFSEDDKKMECELIGLFLKQSDVNIEIMTEHQTDALNTSWVEAAHMLKGGAAGIGAEELNRLCAQAQDMKIATSSDRAALLMKIREAYDKVKQALAVEGLC